MDGESELPIDIHYNKLLDWLIDRRHCNAKWTAQVRCIREKIQLSVPSLPYAQLATLSDRAVLNYFQCRDVLEAVKAVDGDSKSLFGKYSSPRVQEWAEIVKDFEKGSVFLADCAQQLTRNVNYEIPALKQSLARSQQVQQDCLNREQEARSSAASLRSKFQSSCQEMGIKGERVREELQDLLSELPAIFQQIVDRLQTLFPALSYYQSVMETNTGKSVEPATFLPVLHYLLENGNVTVYQWKNGMEPEVEQQLPAQSEEPESEPGGIDWGDLSVTANQSDGIENQSDGIDWNEVETVELADIVVVEESVLAEGGVLESETRDSQQQVKTSADSAGDLESMLLNSATRSLFLDDVMELKEFVSWRLRELTRTDHILSGQFSSDAGELKLQGAGSVQTMLDSVLAVLDPLTSPRTQHLLLMKSSSHYLDRMAASLLSPQLLANKAQSEAELAAARREEAVAAAMSVQPQLSATISETRMLQKQVEQQISRLYKEREVNIIGEINVTLQ